MPPSENPYQSPRIPDAAAVRRATPARHGWKFVLLGIAIAGGIFSLAPWLGVVFAVLSAPVFLRYFVFGWKRPQATPWDYAGSRAAGLTMAFKLLDAAQRTWRRLDAHELLPLVRARGAFKDGQSVERTEPQSEKNTGRVAA